MATDNDPADPRREAWEISNFTEAADWFVDYIREVEASIENRLTSRSERRGAHAFALELNDGLYALLAEEYGIGPYTRYLDTTE